MDKVNQFLNFNFVRAFDEDGDVLWQCRSCKHVTTEAPGVTVTMCREDQCSNPYHDVLYILTLKEQ